VAERSKARTYGQSLAGIAGSNPSGARKSVSCECCVLSGLFYRPITSTEEYEIACVSESYLVTLQIRT
jgi:hypothetical protein